MPQSRSHSPTRSEMLSSFVMTNRGDGSGLVHFDAFDNFLEAKAILPATITPEVITAVRHLDEREEFEPFIQFILSDSNETPHGPAEIADILTHKLTLDREVGLAAFVLKGKSFSTVRPKDVSHQFYRLSKIDGLRFAIFAASGNVLDSAKEEFCSIAQRLSCKYAIHEFHHAVAKSYVDVLARLQPPFLLGMTATPYRSARQDIADLCDHNILVDFDLRSGINMGILSPYHYFGCFDDVDYSKVAHNGIRYDIKDLERALIISERDRAIIAKWRERAEGKPTLAFYCSHEHAKRVAASFVEEGIAGRSLFI